MNYLLQPSVHYKININYKIIIEAKLLFTNVKAVKIVQPN